MLNCPTPSVSDGLRLLRGMNVQLLLLPSSSVRTQAWLLKGLFPLGVDVKAAHQGLGSEAEPLSLSSFLDHHVHLVCMTMQRKLLCCVLSQGITTVECMYYNNSA